LQKAKASWNRPDPSPRYRSEKEDPAAFAGSFSLCTATYYPCAVDRRSFNRTASAIKGVTVAANNASDNTASNVTAKISVNWLAFSVLKYPNTPNANADSQHAADNVPNAQSCTRSGNGMSPNRQLWNRKSVGNPIRPIAKAFNVRTVTTQIFAQSFGLNRSISKPVRNHNNVRPLAQSNTSPNVTKWCSNFSITTSRSFRGRNTARAADASAKIAIPNPSAKPNKCTDRAPSFKSVASMSCVSRIGSAKMALFLLRILLLCDRRLAFPWQNCGPRHSVHICQRYPGRHPLIVLKVCVRSAKSRLIKVNSPAILDPFCPFKLSPSGNGLPCRPARRPGPLKVVPPKPSRHIDRLTNGKQPRNRLGLHRFR